MPLWTVKNPYSGEWIGEVPLISSSEIHHKLQLAQSGFKAWSRAKAFDRSIALENASRKLESERDSFARLISLEAGKPIKLALIETERAVQNLKIAAFEARQSHGELARLDSLPNGRRGFGVIERFPIGPVLGITPFNFPLNLAIHKIAPALAAGCSVIVKPSPFAPLTALKILELFDGLPEGTLQVLPASDSDSARLTAASEIALVSFTGSTQVGWTIRSQALRKPVVLELGGNAWCVIDESLAEQDLLKAAKRVVLGGYGYAGQSCISVQNVAVHESIYRRFRSLLEEETQRFPTGDPAANETLCGPVIHSSAYQRLEGTLRGRARLGFGGKDEAERNLIRPSFVEIDQGHGSDALVQEEIFGPVLTLQPYRDEDELIARINGGRYGLQCGVYTRRLAFAEKCFRELEAGGMIVNDVPTTRYDDAPYGGVKESGFGREGVRYAMEEMTVRKLLAVSSEIV